MAMQMRHGLSSILAVIDHQPVTVFRQAQLARHLSRRQKQVAQELAVTPLRLVYPGNHPFRDDQDMDQRLRVDIPESQQRLILKHDIGLNFSGDDSFKKSLTHNFFYSITKIFSNRFE